MDISPILSSWETVAALAISALVIYPCLIVALRFAGKRSVGNLNNFDWIVTVAIGSVLASAAVTRDFKIVDALVIMVALLSAQYVVTLLTSRYEIIARFVKSDPTILVFLGEFQERNARSVRVSKEEVHAEARKAGHASLASIALMTIESNSEIAVIGRDTLSGDYSAIKPLLSERQFEAIRDEAI